MGKAASGKKSFLQPSSQGIGVWEQGRLEPSSSPQRALGWQNCTFLGTANNSPLPLPKELQNTQSGKRRKSPPMVFNSLELP